MCPQLVLFTAKNFSLSELLLTSADHAGANRTELFVLDENYYLADMKDSSKNFYLNFSGNLVDNSILKIYAKKNLMNISSEKCGGAN